MPSVEMILNSLSVLNLKYKFGVAGSYARGTAKKKSDIDIVVDTDILDLVDIELIKKTLLKNFGKKSDVICLKLLEKEDKELDELAISVGLTPNDESAFKSIIKQIIWDS